MKYLHTMGKLSLCNNEIIIPLHIPYTINIKFKCYNIYMARAK